MNTRSGTHAHEAPPHVDVHLEVCFGRWLPGYQWRSHDGTTKRLKKTEMPIVLLSAPGPAEMGSQRVRSGSLGKCTADARVHAHIRGLERYKTPRRREQRPCLLTRRAMSGCRNFRCDGAPWWVRRKREKLKPPPLFGALRIHGE